MKKKFYTVGTLCYCRNMKCGSLAVAALIGGLAAAGGTVAAASISSSAQAGINAENESLTRESWDTQDRWMNEQMYFNKNEAQKARDFEEQQAGITRDFNAQQALLERQFQSEEAEKTRDWNAVDAQLQRAKDAGVNPAFYINNGFPTSNVTAGGAAASSNGVGSAPSAISSGSPTPNVIPNQAPNLSALSHLSEIGTQFADMNLKAAQADNVKENTKSAITYNRFQDAILKSGLEVNDATVAKMFADVKQIETYVDKINKDIELITANISLVNNEAKIKEIEVYFKSDECKAMIDKLKSETNWNDGMLDYYFQKLPLELGLLKSESAVNSANAALAKARTSLTEHEINQVDAVTSLYQTENANALIDHTVKRMYDVKNAGEDFKQNKAATKQAEYQSSDAVQIIGTTCQIVNSVTGIATSAASVGAAAKYIKGSPKPAKVKGF